MSPSSPPPPNSPHHWLCSDVYEERPGLFSLVFGAFGFPAGFFLVVVAGGELFTSLCLYMTVAWWEGEATAADCLRLWALAWAGNFAGAAAFLGLMLAGGALAGPRGAFAALLAAQKARRGFGRCLALGAACNFLVSLAAWAAKAARDAAGRFVAVWLPISAFAMLGFEHCIAVGAGARWGGVGARAFSVLVACFSLSLPQLARSRFLSRSARTCPSCKRNAKRKHKRPANNNRTSSSCHWRSRSAAPTSPRATLSSATCCRRRSATGSAARSASAARTRSRTAPRTPR